MTEWWTNQDAALIGAIGGSFIGVFFGGIGGGIGGPLAAKGIGKPFVLGLYIVGIALGAVLSAGAIAALIDGQPYHVWYPLSLGGVLLLFVMTPLFFVLRLRYRQHEERKLAAEELRRA